MTNRLLTARFKRAPNQRPPVCLRYAMWTMSSSVTDKFANLKDLFYQRARKYVEADCLKGYGEHMISVAQCQTHILLAAYEMKMMYFPRTWINTGSAIRLAQMCVYILGLGSILIGTIARQNESDEANTFCNFIQDRTTSARWYWLGRQAVSAPTQGLDRTRRAPSNVLDGLLRGSLYEHRDWMAHDD